MPMSIPKIGEANFFVVEEVDAILRAALAMTPEASAVRTEFER